MEWVQWYSAQLALKLAVCLVLSTVGPEVGSMPGTANSRSISGGIKSC